MRVAVVFVLVGLLFLAIVVAALLFGLVAHGGQRFGAFDLVLELVVPGGDVLTDGLCPAGLALLLNVDLVLRLGAAEDGTGKWVKVGHDSIPDAASYLAIDRLAASIMSGK